MVWKVYNELYYFEIEEKEARLMKNLDEVDIPEEADDYRFSDKSSSICEYDHPLPCGLDQECDLIE
jgi:hypothetical protein